MADAHRRALIGVTGPRSRAQGPRACVAAALRLSGARSVQLRPGDGFDLGALHGIVVTGGHDVDPALYSAASEVRGRYDPERDAFESEILDRAIATGLPVLAICRGAQLLNVRLGGTLVQDLTARRKLTSNRRTLLPLKTVRLAEGSRLAELLGSAPLKVNSLHRQAIERLGDGLRVSGRDLDGIVQAIEHERHAFVRGVQWHPEFLIYLRRQRELFADLVREATRSEEAG
jgi:putative glutamine amidotransferase